jgi:hypothetical protein
VKVTINGVLNSLADVVFDRWHPAEHADEPLHRRAPGAI